MSGNCEVHLRYTDSRDEPASSCRHGGLEDVVVVAEGRTGYVHCTPVLDPGDRDWVHVMWFVVP